MATTTCLRCGTPLPDADEAGNAVCQSCGLFHHPELEPDPSGSAAPDAAAAPSSPGRPGVQFGAGATGLPPAPPLSSPGVPPGVVVGGAAPACSGWAAGCVVAVVVGVLAVIGIAVASIAGLSRAISDSSDAADAVRPDPSGTLVLDDARQAVVLGTDGSGARFLALVDPGGEAVWKASIVPPDANGARMGLIDPDDPAVVAAVGTGLVALDLDDGQVRWRRDLSDVVDPACESCLALVDGQVVVFTADATLAAFDPGTGAPTWTHRLESAQGKVHPVGTRLVVTDQAPEPGSPARMDVLEGGTGTVVHQITPSCPSPAFGPDSTVTIDLGLDDPVVAVPGTEDVVAVFGTFEICTARWSTASGERLWSVERDDLGGLFQPELSIDGSTLLVADRSTLWTVSLGEGSITLVPLPPDTTLGPAVLRGGTVVVGLSSTRGTARWEVAGLDTATGEQLWSEPAEAGAEPLTGLGAGIGTVSATDSLFALLPRGEDEVSLVSVAIGRDTTVRALDARTGDGTPVGGAELALGPFGLSGSTLVRTVSLDPEGVVLVVDSVLQVIDPATGQITSF